jgi:hypothetical protein
VSDLGVEDEIQAYFRINLLWDCNSEIGLGVYVLRLFWNFQIFDRDCYGLGGSLHFANWLGLLTIL